MADGYYVLSVLQAERSVAGPSEGDRIFPTVLLGVSVVIIGWTFLFRWIYKGLLIGRRRAPDSVASYVLLPLIGALIWTPSGAVAIYGVLIFSSSGSFVWFFTFMGISCALLMIHMPCFLDPRRGTTAGLRSE